MARSPRAGTESWKRLSVLWIACDIIRENGRLAAWKYAKMQAFICRQCKVVLQVTIHDPFCSFADLISCLTYYRQYSSLASYYSTVRSASLHWSAMSGKWVEMRRHCDTFTRKVLRFFCCLPFVLNISQ